MSKKVQVFLVIVVCVGAILGGFFSYKKYLNNLNNENKEKTNMEEKHDNKEPDKNEVKELLNTIIRCDGDTNYMHEGFNKDNPKEFTRDWFAWANSLFADFIYKKLIKE